MRENINIAGNDIIIRIRPHTNKDGTYWTGGIEVDVISSKDNTLSDHSYSEVMHFTKMVASSIPVMEENEELRNAIHDFVNEYIDNEAEDMLEDHTINDNKKNVIGEDGNVVKINFNTKTGGNA